MDYSFDADIWGTVSDWVMIFVTFATAILLLLTLKSQKEVQQTQNELFRIESIRFRESIKPILKFSVHKYQPKTDNKDKRIFTLEVNNETNATALHITRHVETNENTKQLFGPEGLDGKRDHLTKGDKPILLHFSIDSETSTYILFTIKYKDVAETKYKQRVLCLYDEDYETEIHPSLPEIIS
jgi:hypothetical protein